MLCLVLGDLGSGKTLFLAYVASHTPDIPILSNFPLKLSNYQVLEPENLLSLKYKEALILIDEGYTEIESRTSGNSRNLYWSYILFQSRKRGLDFYVASQLASTLDIRFRDMANIIIFCDKQKQGFIYHILKQSALHPSETTRILSYEKAEKLYPIYETKKPVMPPQMQELQMDFIIQDKVKLTGMIDRALNEIGDIGKITRERVELALLEKGYPKRLAKYVYAKLKR